jgi:hypothetical protein
MKKLKKCAVRISYSRKHSRWDARVKTPVWLRFKRGGPLGVGNTACKALRDLQTKLTGRTDAVEMPDEWQTFLKDCCGS